jgi:O-glycosyl hydrolase
MSTNRPASSSGAPDETLDPHVLTYHSYWSDNIPDQLVPHREKLAATLVAHPGWRLWQTEYCVMDWRRDLGIETALRVARVIHCDLAIANASAWHWWLAVSKENYKDGLIYTDWKKPGDEENILPSKTFWALGNYSRFIRPGMRRVGVRGGEQDVNGMMASAYLDQAARKVVMVLVNISEAPRTVRVALGRGERVAAAALKATPHVTSATQDLEAGEAVELASGFTVPARSVMTLVTIPEGAVSNGRR